MDDWHQPKNGPIHVFFNVLTFGGGLNVVVLSVAGLSVGGFICLGLNVAVLSVVVLSVVIFVIVPLGNCENFQIGISFYKCSIMFLSFYMAIA